MLNAPPTYPTVLPTGAGSAAETIEAAQDSTVFETDYTYEQFPQRIGDTEHHHYWQVWPIGVVSGPQNAMQITPGLTVGAQMRIVAEKNPEVWLISISSKTANAVANVYLGEAGGFAITLGPGGNAVIPARGSTLTIVASGATVAGSVAAMGNLEQGVPAPSINVGAL